MIYISIVPLYEDTEPYASIQSACIIVDNRTCIYLKDEHEAWTVSNKNGIHMSFDQWTGDNEAPIGSVLVVSLEDLKINQFVNSSSFHIEFKAYQI